MDIAKALQQAIRDSGRTLYRVGKDSGVDYSVLLRFMADERDIRLATAARLAGYLGLELRPARPRPSRQARH